MSIAPHKASGDAAMILGDADVVVLDLDGVLYEGDTAIAGAVEAVDAIAASGRRIGFLTNNSGNGRAHVAAKLTRLGFRVPTIESVWTAFDEAVAHAKTVSIGAPPFIVGSAALRAAIAAVAPSSSSEVFSYLLVGFDANLNYADIAAASKLVRRGKPFVICNRDAVFPTGGGELAPGCGAAVAAIEVAGGRSPDLVLGKPNPAFLSSLLKNMDAASSRVLVIGDGLSSDIRMARDACAASVWIGDVSLHGSSDTRADHVARSLADFARQAGVL